MENTLGKLNELISRAFSDISGAEQRAISDAGFDNISVHEAHTVEAIGLYMPKTMSAVAEKLNITMGTLTVCINILMRKGIVVKKRSDLDKRVFMLTLTSEGRRLYRVHQRFHLELVSSLIADLSDYEADMFLDALSSLNRFLAQGQA